MLTTRDNFHAPYFIKYLVNCAGLIAALLFTQASAAQTNYHVSLLRAAPGFMPELIEQAKATKQALKGDMLIMRHSQGDHWDLMLMMPQRAAALNVKSYQSLVNFQHDFLVKSEVGWDALQSESKGADLFHIEMFQAGRGLYDKLLEQRMMENNYLQATQRTTNFIFETLYGSDVDMFTLGIHKDLLSFAFEPDLPAHEFEKAATDAGFKARSDIGFYLRELLVGHQDTLASQVD